MFKDRMELLELTQGDGVGSLVHCVQKFNMQLTFFPFKKEFARMFGILGGCTWCNQPQL
jgi:hypothetical protein